MISTGSGVAEPFLTGGGDMALRIAGHDWSGSLGPVAAWPVSLKTTVGLMLHSPVPLVLLWNCRIWLATARGYMHHDPILYAARDRVTWAIAACVAGAMLAARGGLAP
jgi:hypothetical protein